MHELIDSHAHLTCDGTNFINIHEILARAQIANVTKIVNICTDLESLERALELKKQYPWIFNSAAITPHDVEKIGESSFPTIVKAAKDKMLVAIGEKGLDYHYKHSKIAIQKDFLRRYLHLALECQLPVIIHCREAFNDFFEILDKEYFLNNKLGKGVLHCFTGTMSEAENVLNRGFYLSLSGIVTFKKSHELQEIAKMVPLNQLLIETDAPYLAPQGKRGKINEPAYIVETATFIAKIKNIPLEELLESTSKNASDLFSLHNL